LIDKLKSSKYELNEFLFSKNLPNLEKRVQNLLVISKFVAVLLTRKAIISDQNLKKIQTTIKNTSRSFIKFISQQFCSVNTAFYIQI
jgi:hypothetical protein